MINHLRLQQNIEDEYEAQQKIISQFTLKDKFICK